MAVGPSHDDLKPQCLLFLLRCWPAATWLHVLLVALAGSARAGHQKPGNGTPGESGNIAPCSRLAIANHQAIASEAIVAVHCLPTCMHRGMNRQNASAPALSFRLGHPNVLDLSQA